MALIGKIRENSWILIILIGGGLAGFIIMSMFSGKQSVFGSGQTVMAKVEGHKIDIREFNNLENILYGNSAGDSYGRRQFLWNYFVEEAIINKEAEAIGLGVSQPELMELQFGPDDKLSPIIVARYQDPNTRQVNRQQLNQLKQIIEQNQINDLIQAGQLQPNFPYFWAHQEKEIVKDRLQTKMLKMVEKGLYTPSWMAEMVSIDQNQKVDFAFVQIPFDEIDNNDVALTEGDYGAYLEKNKAQYAQDEETRKVEYVTFDVIATPEDSAKLHKQVADLIAPFRETEDDSIFVENNYGSIDAAYYKKGSLSPIIADTVFKMPVGSVFGPYEENGAYKAVKILDRKTTVPDSVRAKHILRKATNPQEYLQAQNTIDSLKRLIEAGTEPFDSLAAKFSDDLSNAAKGGDLGFAFQGQMVKPFNDLIFFEAEPGKVYSVVTQFGVHLVEVTDRKFITNEPAVQLAYITQSIIPSEDTQNAIREDALQFVEQNRTLAEVAKAISSREDLELETSPPVKRNDYAVGSLGPGQPSRDIIRWAFNNDPNVEGASIGDVSPEIYRFQDAVEYYTNKYVVVGLKNILPAGAPIAANLKEDIEPQVINDKKAELIKERISGKTDLNSIATEFNLKADTAQNVSFTAGFIPSLGSEPKVVAAAFNLGLNTLSTPIQGNSGVFVIMPTYKQPADVTNSNIPQIRQTNQNASRTQVSARLMQALRKNADIEDNRARFF